MEQVKVNKITDIPDIEKFLNKEFSFQCYWVGDNTWTFHNLNISLTVICDNFDVFRETELTEIITHSGLLFVDWCVCDGDNNITSWYVWKKGDSTSNNQ